MGLTVLHKVQYGLEGTEAHGTAVAADTMILGQVTLPDSDREVVIPGFGTGQRIPGQINSAFVRRILAEGVTLATPADRGGAYFQLFPLLFSSCIVGGVTPSEQTGGQADYLWTHAVPLTAAETLDTFTLEMADDAKCYEMAHTLCPELEIAGNADSGEVTISANLVGDEIARTTVTGAISAPSATFVVGKLAKVYIDDTWAALGSNEVADALLDWTISINGGSHPKLRGGATRHYETHGQGEVEITLTLGLERTSGVDTESAYYYANTTTKRFVRVEIVSDVQIGTGSYHTLTFDAAGVWTAWQPFGRDQDGNAIDVATLRVGVDNTSGSSFTAAVITNVSAI